jgi:hypothetical protein
LIVKRQVVIKNPKPAISAAQLQSYQGKYQSKNDSDNIIQLIAKGRQLIVKQDGIVRQAWLFNTTEFDKK